MAATRAPFLKTRYGGYFHRDIPEEDAELTHVGPGTTGGEYLRRFWQPVCFSDDLKDLPLKVRMLGEDLVAYRDRRGALGLLELHCPHRGTSLEFGLVGEEGIRCCYHGWLFGADGAILETPGEPEDSTLKDKLWHGAYPVHEYGGVVFAYMGPPDKKPAFPVYDTFARPGWRMIPGPQILLSVQLAADARKPHGPGAHRLPAHDRQRCCVHPGVRRPARTRLRRDADRHDLCRDPPGRRQCLGADGRDPAAEPVAGGADLGDRARGMPFSGPMMSRWTMPLDDTHTMFLEFRHVGDKDGETPDWWADRNIMLPGQLAADTYEEGQLHPGDFEAQVSQRPIAIHGLEHLGATDRGVSMFRNQIRRGQRAVQAGNDPAGLCRQPGATIPTYCNNTVMRRPANGSAETDKEMMRRTGRELAQSYLREPPLMAGR